MLRPRTTRPLGASRAPTSPPTKSGDFEKLRTSLETQSLSEASFSFEPMDIPQKAFLAVLGDREGEDAE